MSVTPSNIPALSEFVKQAASSRSPIKDWDLSRLAQITEYHSEDLTITVEAGMTLADLQASLAAHRQWLPIDPPAPEQLSIERMLALDLSGPRRLGHGTARDWLIGLKVVQGNGTLMHSGGRVVKNVAGFDLMKLFIGSAGSLGILIEAAFKVAPLPEAEVFLFRICDGFDALHDVVESVSASSLAPVVFDAYRGPFDASITVVLGFSGCREEVSAQVGAAESTGWSAGADLTYDGLLRPHLPDHRSTLPSELVHDLAEIRPLQFVARLGNGVALVPGGLGAKRIADPAVTLLEQRLKSTFDPAGILPPIPD